MMTGIRNVEICWTADETMELLKKGYRPDIALIAPELRGIHGIQLIQKIRNFFDTGKNEELPILLLIKNPDKAMLRHACRAGVEGAIRKPLDHAKIGRLILNALTKPRRFIAVRNYFGPERRKAEDPAFKGPERRQPLGEHESIATKERRIVEQAKPVEKAVDKPEVVGGKSAEPSKPVKQPAVLSDPNITPISQYHLPTPLEEQVAQRPKGGKVVSDDEVPAVKPTAKALPVNKTLPPQPEAKPQPAPVAKAAPKPVPAKAVKPVPEKTRPTKPVAQPKAPPKETAPKGVETAKPQTPKKEAAPEVEIVDIDDALQKHRLWVDSAGREGEALSVKRANLRGADLEEADLTGASLIQANFTDANLTQVILRKANLTGSIFANTKMEGANLAVARLKRANLSKAQLNRAVLRGADLSGARFKGASLVRTDLSSANLANTDFTGANLSMVVGLIQEQVDRACLDEKTALPAGIKASSQALARKPQGGLSGLRAKAVRAPDKG